MMVVIRLDARTREALEGRFQRRFFEAVVSHDPTHLDALVQLGDIYTRQGQYEKGLEIDSRLTELCPDEPNFHYNLACSFSVLGRCDESLNALALAVRLGYDDLDSLQRDEDLKNLRRTASFRRFIAKLSREQ